MAMAALAMMLGGMTLAPAASAETDPDTLLRDGLYCEQTATPEGFRVVANRTPQGTDRLVYERNVYNRYWWRGATDFFITQLDDAPAPPTTAKADYRVTAKAANGTVLERVNCDIAPTPGLACRVSNDGSTGGYRVEVNADGLSDQVGGELEFIVRRTIRPGGTTTWRQRTTSTSISESASPTGFVSYRIWARSDRRIVGAANCLNDMLDSECVSDITRAEYENLAAPLATPVGPAIRAQLEALVFPGNDVEEAVEGPAGLVAYLVAGETESLWTFNTTTAENLLIDSSIELSGFVSIDHVDAAGGIYIAVSTKDGGSWRYYGPDGRVFLGFDDQFTYDAVRVVGTAPDGRTILHRWASPLESLSGTEPVFRRTYLRDPFTGEVESFPGLDAARFVRSADNGDLLMSIRGLDGQTDYVRYDISCLL